MEEQLLEVPMPTGATLPDQTLTESVRLVGENCVATVPSSTAFGTECGDAMPSEDADPDDSGRSIRWMDSGVQGPETQVLYVQTPAVSSRGRDGFDSDAFAGSNAVFCRQAFDSIGGIQYGTPSEDAFTGNVVHTSGWDSVYFRKDFEGDAKDRIRFRPGLASAARACPGPEAISSVPAQDVFLRLGAVPVFGSIPALHNVAIAVCYLCTGDAPIYARGTKFLYSFLIVTFCRWVLNLLANIKLMQILVQYVICVATCT
ncbi:unnamed protein product [Hyaloperonospora brassicae]|uniref:Uncharacterized protein n=1 Tax=Hyaloperonospora brassicae TaxID=162125 RepID=A0AAV0TAP5_HYABA|nr:unnamed protein product [Hyaloperonospora brassicae]